MDQTRKHLHIVPILLLFGFAGFSQTQAAEGPGISNNSYPAESVGEILSVINPEKAVSATAVHRGYLFVPLSQDHGGGQGVGAFAFYDVSDPRSPRLVMDSRDDPGRYHNSRTLNYVGDWAEQHHISTSGDLFLISERRNGSAGFSIFDAAPLYDDDPTTMPEIVSRYSFRGVTSPSNYDGFSFAPGWQGSRYVFAPTGAQGLYIIDTSDLENPRQLAHLSRSALGNVTLRAAWPIGNLLILCEADTQNQFQARIYDISNPANPVQSGSFSGPFGYHGFVYGSKFYNAASPMWSYDFTDPSAIIATNHGPAAFDRPEYGFGKDGHLFIGHYPGGTKWKIEGDTLTQVASVNSGLIDDHAFLNPVGNLLAVCSDHNNPLKIMLGVAGPDQDTSPPEAMFTSPPDGSLNQSIHSRIGISFNDFVDPTSANVDTIEVINLGSGEIVPGTYSAMMGIVNFAPNVPFELNATYDLVLKAGGVKDQAGNSISTDQRLIRFSTGSEVQGYDVSINSTTPIAVAEEAVFSISVINENELTLEHSWTFGDGSPPTEFSSATEVQHTFSQPGNFAISVRSRIAGQSYAPAVHGSQIVHVPISPLPPSNQTTIAIDPDHPLVWNVNPDNDSVTAIDSITLSRRWEIPVGENPVALALGSNDQLWAINKESGTVTSILRATGEILATYPLPTGSEPSGIVYDRSSSSLFVSLRSLGEVVRIDPSNGLISDRIPVGPTPKGLSIDPVRRRLWVSRFISPDEGGVVTCINLDQLNSLTEVRLAPVMEPDGLQNGRGIPNYLGAVTLSPDLTQAFVPAKKDNIFRGIKRDGLPLTFEHSVRSMAARLDLSSGLEMPGSSIDFDNSDFATAAAFSPLGNMVYFLTSGSSTVWAADAYRPDSNYTFESGGTAPDGLAISADGSRMFIHNFMERNVTVFELGSNPGSTSGTTPQIAIIPTVSAEKLPADVLRGKHLFYDTSDPRLAQEGYMSCASCHLDGGQDGRVWDFTNLGEGLRNTIDLTGKGVGHGPAHWTGNFDETQDFEGQIRDFASGTGLMSNPLFHAGSRSQPLGESKAGISTDLDALAAYVASLTKVGISPHRSEDGSLSMAATAGREIFRQENCASCHGGSAFSDSAALVRHDVGTLRQTSGQRLGNHLDGLDTPSLRGLWKSPPYLHDGSAATLRDVFLSRDLSGRHAGLFHRSPLEMDQLVAYLESIDDLEIQAPTPHSTDGPLATIPAVMSHPVHQSLTVELSAAPGSGNLLWSAIGLPAGLEIDPATGVISGAPAQAGTFTARIAVRDEFGRSSDGAFQWIIVDPAAFRYVKLASYSSHNGQWFSSVADFNLLDADQTELARANWTASASTAETLSEQASASRAIDDLTATFWHSAYSSGAPPFPHDLIIDLGEPKFFRGFNILARQDGNENGRIRAYRFYRSNDPANWGEPVSVGDLANHASRQTVIFSQNIQVPPVFTTIAPEWQLTENSVIGTRVGEVIATDSNAGQTIQYRLGSGNVNQAFSIDPTTGEVFTAGPIDFETLANYQLQIIATDNATTPLSSSTVVRIHVENVIETNEELVRLRLTSEEGPFPGHGNPSLVGFTADPDGDGTSNALEILFGSDPSTPSSPPEIKPIVQSFDGEMWLVYEFQLNSHHDLTFTCMGSDDLSNWEPLSNLPVLIAESDGISTWQLKENLPIAQSPVRYMRVEIHH